MKELFIALLSSLGVSDEVIEILKSEDEAKIKALKADDIYKEAQDMQKEILAEDAEFLAPLKAETIKGLLITREKEFLRDFKDYVSQSDLDALPEKNRYDALVKLAAKKVKEKAKEGTTPDDKDKEIDRLNSELEKRDEIIKDFEEVKLPGVQKEWEGKMTQKEIDGYLRTTFNELSDQLIAKPAGLYPAAYTAITAKYDFKREDDGTVTLLAKGTTNKARNGTKEVQVKEAFKTLSDENGWIKKSEEPPKKDPIKEGGPEKKINLSGKQKFDEALKLKEEQMAAGQ